MKIQELLSEAVQGKMSKRQNQSTRGVNIFSDAERWNADYVAYRLGMGVASTDGNNVPNMDS